MVTRFGFRRVKSVVFQFAEHLTPLTTPQESSVAHYLPLLTPLSGFPLRSPPVGRHERSAVVPRGEGAFGDQAGEHV
jgi:hypothetical protein